MALALVTQLRDLAAVEENRYFIVRDQGCLPALVPHLNSSESEVVCVALEALHFLSLYPGNRSMMAKEAGLVKMVRNHLNHSDEAVKQKAMATYINLQGYIKQAPNTPQGQSQAQTRGLTKQKTNTPSEGAKKPNRKMANAKTITLYISGMTNDNHRKQLETALLRVRGVVSFLIDLYAQKAVIRTLVSAETLVRAIRDTTGMTASQRKHSPDASGTPEPDKENDAPGYLDDSTDDLQEHSKTALAKQDDKNDPQQAWGWGLGRISKALWG